MSILPLWAHVHLLCDVRGQNLIFIREEERTSAEKCLTMRGQKDTQMIRLPWSDRRE